MPALMLSNNPTRPSPYRSAAPPRSPGPPPAEPLPQLPQMFEDYAESPLEPCWAQDAIRYSTIFGALHLTVQDLKLLIKVPYENITDSSQKDRRVTRTDSMIMAGQRIDFGFGVGHRALRHRGMPMYALANASEEELERNMSAAAAKVMAPFSLRRIRLRFVWPLPEGSDPSYMMYEEWIRVDETYTRVQVAMEVAQVFNKFVEHHRSMLSSCANYRWLLRPDAFYRVWLLGLERVENNVFVANLRYIKEYPNE